MLVEQKATAGKDNKMDPVTEAALVSLLYPIDLHCTLQVGCVGWVLGGAARHGLEPATLTEELLQLGTPREHATALGRVYKERGGELVMAARQASLRTSRLASVDWRVELPLGQGQSQVWARLELHLSSGGKTDTKKIVCSPGKLAVLLRELQQAAAVMDNLMDE